LQCGAFILNLPCDLYERLNDLLAGVLGALCYRRPELVRRKVFGKGINGMSSDFGHLGEKPSHPELLDWLTSQFIKSDGKIKDLHRLIVTSATYRQSARSTRDSAQALVKDPDNRLLWRFSPHRLDAEQVQLDGELLNDVPGMRRKYGAKTAGAIESVPQALHRDGVAG